MLASIPASVSPEEALCLSATRWCCNLEKKCCTFRGLHVTRLDIFRSLMLIVEHTSVGAVAGGAFGVVAGGIAGAIAGGMAGAIAGGIAGGATSAAVLNPGNVNDRLVCALGDCVIGGLIGIGVHYLLKDDLGIGITAKGAVEGVITGSLVGTVSGLTIGIEIVKNNFFIRNRFIERSDPVVQLSSMEESDQMLTLSSRGKTPIRNESAQSTVVIIENQAFGADIV